MCLSFFLFQAEDGIRDSSVTGVQTCALPIFIDHVDRPVAGHSSHLSNLLQVPVGYGGEGTAVTGNGSVDVIYDVVGYYTGDTSSGAGEFPALTPSRILDTRTGTGGFSAPGRAAHSNQLQVTRPGVVPAATSSRT